MDKIWNLRLWFISKDSIFYQALLIGLDGEKMSFTHLWFSKYGSFSVLLVYFSKQIAWKIYILMVILARMETFSLQLKVHWPQANLLTSLTWLKNHSYWLMAVSSCRSSSSWPCFRRLVLWFGHVVSQWAGCISRSLIWSLSSYSSQTST